MNSFGERIKYLRKKEKLTQKAFASKLGITPSYVSKLESNKENASDTLIKLICSEFGVNDNWLRKGNGPVESEYIDYDKTESTIIGASALLVLTNLLKTPSNVKYSLYSDSLSSLVNILCAEGFDGENIVPFLENFMVLMSYLNRMTSSCKRLLLEKEVQPEEVIDIITLIKRNFNCVYLALGDIVDSYLQQSMKNGFINIQEKDKIYNFFTKGLEDK